MKHKFPNEKEIESCIYCNCAEGTLPTDCPGYEVPLGIQEEIYHGSLDFREGEWQAKKDYLFANLNSNFPVCFPPKRLTRYYKDHEEIAKKICEDSCIFSKWLKEMQN